MLPKLSRWCQLLKKIHFRRPGEAGSRVECGCQTHSINCWVAKSCALTTQLRSKDRECMKTRILNTLSRNAAKQLLSEVVQSPTQFIIPVSLFLLLFPFTYFFQFVLVTKQQVNRDVIGGVGRKPRNLKTEKGRQII